MPQRQPRTTPLPLDQRRPAWMPAFVWSGFCAAFVCVLIGARLQEALGTIDAALAIVVGNWLLFLYTAGIGFACGRWGMSFSLAMGETFGRNGARLPALLMAVLVAGWFSVQLDVVTVLVQKALALPESVRPLTCTVLGLLFVLPLFAGAGAGFNLTPWALPAMLLFGALALSGTGQAAVPATSVVPVVFSDRFVDGVAVAFGTFVVSATMTGDIVRVCRTGSAADGATAIAFLLSNLPFMLLGVLMSGPGGDLLESLGLAAREGGRGQLMVALAALSSWAACDACLVNASLSLTDVWSRLGWRRAVTLVGALGTAVAVLRLFPPLFDWILLLAMLVPPIGSALLVDYFLSRAGAGYATSRGEGLNLPAIAGVAAGMSASVITRALAPGLLYALIGMMAAAVVQLAVARLRRSGAQPRGTGPDSGAQAIDA